MSSAFTWNLFLFYQSKKSAINFMKSAREEADLNLQKKHAHEYYATFLYIFVALNSIFAINYFTIVSPPCTCNLIFLLIFCERKKVKRLRNTTSWVRTAPIPSHTYIFLFLDNDL